MPPPPHHAGHARSRRDLLRTMIGAAGAGGLVPLLAACDDDATRPASGPPTTASSPVSSSVTVANAPSSTLPQPALRRAGGDTLSVTLRATPASVDVGAPKPITTYTFDGGIPGSTWELRRGQTLAVDLVNELPELESLSASATATTTTVAEASTTTSASAHVAMENRPHGWTNTNLHTHGLHVSPVGDGDNIFATVEPGQTRQIRIPIPQDHPGGTFWYHPHRHGGVEQQVRGGMAGVIIVRGEIDEVPEIAAASEHVMVVQGLEVDADYQVPAPQPDPSTPFGFWPSTQTVYTINGRVLPTISMAPGEVQRWRLLNATGGTFLTLALDGHDLNAIAWDGLTLPAPAPASSLSMVPANRLDVLVQAGRPGTYQLMMTDGTSKNPDPGVNPPGGATTTTTPADRIVPQPLATVVVAGDAKEMSMPDTLPAWDPPMLPIARRRSVTYDVHMQGGQFVDFGVGGQPFSSSEQPYQIPIDTAEEWTVTNAVAGFAHAFHIHVNPFKVTAVNGSALDPPQWRDTYLITPNGGDSFTFQSNFTDFTGRYVNHCHVLAHEDLGMMEIVEVVA